MQHKTLRIINLQSSDSPNDLLYQGNRVLNIVHLINHKNTFLIRNKLKKKKQQIFLETIIMFNRSQNDNARATAYLFLDISQLKITHFGEYSVNLLEPRIWTLWIYRISKTIVLGISCQLKQ